MGWSQFGEFEVLKKLMRLLPIKNKILVDVGACGRLMSNSYDLLKEGWKGLLIEADPERIPFIEQEFAGLDATICQCGVSDKEEDATFYKHNVLGHSSFLSDWYPPTKTDQVLTIRCRPLADILTENKIPVDFSFLSVDTEGMDCRIVTHMFEHSEYRPHIIVAECTSFNGPYQLFHDNGYEYYTKTGNEGWGNFIYVKRGVQ